MSVINPDTGESFVRDMKTGELIMYSNSEGSMTSEGINYNLGMQKYILSRDIHIDREKNRFSSEESAKRYLGRISPIDKIALEVRIFSGSKKDYVYRYEAAKDIVSERVQ